MIDAWAAFEIALSQINAGRPAEALPALKMLAARFPDAPVFQTTYGRALKDAGRPAEAVAVYRRAVTRIRDASLFHDLAVAARAAGNHTEALKAEQAALALEGRNPAALNGLGLLHIEAGRAKDAVAAFEQASGTRSVERVLLDQPRKRAEGARRTSRRPMLRIAARSTSTPPTQTRRTASAFSWCRAGKPADAVQWFERAIEHAPDFYEARLNLGIALQESGQRERAAAVYREILAKAPPRFRREREAAAQLQRQLAR